MKARRSAYDELDQYIKGYEASPQSSSKVLAKTSSYEPKSKQKNAVPVKTQPSSSANKPNAPILEDKSFQQRLIRLDDEIEHFARRVEMMRSSRLQQLRQMRQSMLSDISFSEELDAAAMPNSFDTKYIIEEEFQSFLLGESEPHTYSSMNNNIASELSLEAVSHLQIQRKAHRSKLRQLSQNIEDILSQSLTHTRTDHMMQQQQLEEKQSQYNQAPHVNTSPMSAMTGSDSEGGQRAERRNYHDTHIANTQNTSSKHNQPTNNTQKSRLDKTMIHSGVLDIFSDDITGSPPLPPPSRSSHHHHKNASTIIAVNTTSKIALSNSDSVMEGFLTHRRSQSSSQSFDGDNEIPSLADLPPHTQTHTRNNQRFLLHEDERDVVQEEEEEEFDLFELASSHLDQFMDDSHQAGVNSTILPKTPTSAPLFS